MAEIVSFALGAYLWEKHGDNLIEWLQNQAKEKGQKLAQDGWKKFQWQKAERDYKEKSLKLYGTTRVLGNPEPTKLSSIFTDLYILDKPLATRRFSIEQLHEADNEKLHGNDVERRNGLDIVKQKTSHRLFILGKPGAGKTTFLKYINLQAIHGKLDKTPILVTLREWTDTDKPLMGYIVEQFAICNFPKADSFIEYLLEYGLAIVLFDGLDEVNQEHNPRICREIQNFCKRYDKSQCLITCRVAAADYSFEHFNYVEVADFTPEQIETFVQKWFVLEPQKGEQFLEDLKAQQHGGLYELARSPLLLGMLCLAFGDSMAFPNRRAEIYEDAIDALLRKWDTSRSIRRDEIYKNLTHRLKKQLFAAIAYKTFAENRYLLPEKELSAYLERGLKTLPGTETAPDGDIVLKAIAAQHGIFVERAQKIHSFAHLSFQEYFAASHIASKASYQTELLKHITEPRWREVILLTASLLSDADDFVSLFRTAIDDLVKSDAQLVALLQWANNAKAHSIVMDASGNRSSAICVFYIFLVCAQNLDLAHDLDFGLARDFDRVLAFARAYARDIARELNLAHTLDLALAHTLDLHGVIAPDFALALDLARYSKSIAVDYLMILALLVVQYFSNAWHFENTVQKHYHLTLEFFQDSIRQIQEWGFDGLVAQLNALMASFPSQTATQNQWQQFTGQFRQLLQHERNIAHQWELTLSQLSILSNYLAANSLLVECLKIATVSDREAIKENLLTPPRAGLI